MQDNYQFGHTDDDVPFALSNWAATRIAIPILGKGGLRSRLMMDMFELTGKAPNSEAQTTAADMAQALALGHGGRANPQLRVAQADGGFVLDLGRRDGLLIGYGPWGWRPVTDPPVVFRRSGATREMPAPVQGAQLPPAVRQLVNVRGEDSWSLYLAGRVAALIPNVTRPIELLTGQPGSAKTGTTRLSVEWTGGAMMTMQKEPKGWAATAAACQCMGLDNVSHLSGELSDVMCRAASGDTYQDRMLYSDGDLFIVTMQPVSMMLNGIELGALRGDLVSRSVSHHLERPGHGYLSEHVVKKEWHQAWPEALGWLLGVTCWVLADMAWRAPVTTHRLTDFASLLASVDRMRGTNGMTLWLGRQAEVHENTAEGDVLALALVRAAATTGQLYGTPAQLLETLRRAGGLMDDRLVAWTPRLLGSRLDRAQLGLETLGWKIESRVNLHSKSREILITPPQ